RFFPSCSSYRTTRKRPFLGQARHPPHRASPGIEQPIARICVRLAPCTQVFRHPALCWPPRPPGISPLHPPDSPDGLPSLSGQSLNPEGFKIRPPYLIQAHHRADPDRAALSTQTLTAHTGNLRHMGEGSMRFFCVRLRRGDDVRALSTIRMRFYIRDVGRRSHAEKTAYYGSKFGDSHASIARWGFQPPSSRRV